MVTSEMWLGLNDIATEAGGSRTCCWGFGSGASPSYIRSLAGAALWGGGEPNNAGSAPGEDCVVVPGNRLLNDVPCTHPLPWGCCEAPMATPSTSPSPVASVPASGSGSASSTPTASLSVDAQPLNTQTPAASVSASPPSLPLAWSPARLAGDTFGLLSWLRLEDVQGEASALAQWPNAAGDAAYGGLPSWGRPPYVEPPGSPLASRSGLRPVRFDALSSSDGQNLVINASLAQGGVGDWTLVFVARWVGPASWQRLASGVNNNFAVGGWLGTTNTLIVDGDTISGGAVPGTGNGTSGWTLWSARASLPFGTVSLFRNGTLLATKAASSAMRGPAGLRLGGGFGTVNGAANVGEYSSCAFAEVLLFNSSLPDYELQGLEGYLSWRHGIQLNVTHPFAGAWAAPAPPEVQTPSRTPTSTQTQTQTASSTRTQSPTATQTRTASPTSMPSITATTSWSPAPASCPGPGWYRPPGSTMCYRPMNLSLSFGDAHAHCASLAPGGGLASVHGPAEAAFVFGQRCGFGWTSASFLVGLNDINGEAFSSRSCCWSWSDGSSSAWMRSPTGGHAWWLGPEPNNLASYFALGEDVVEVNAAGFLNDVYVSNVSPFCCGAPAATASPSATVSPSATALPSGSSGSSTPSPTFTGSPAQLQWTPAYVPGLITWHTLDDVQAVPSALWSWPNAGGNPAFDAVPLAGRAPWVEEEPSLFAPAFSTAGGSTRGYRAVRFDVTDGGMDGQALVTNVTSLWGASPSSGGGGTSFTLLFLARYTGGPWARLLAGAASNFLAGGWQGGTGNLALENEWAVGGAGGTGSGPSGWTLFTVVASLPGGSVALYRNGTLVGSRAASATMRGPLGLRLGGGFSPGGSWDQASSGVPEYSSCAFAELAVYGRALGDYERQGLEGYATWKYNLTGLLPAGHPYAVGSGAGAPALPVILTPTPTVTSTRSSSCTPTATLTPSRTATASVTTSGTSTASVTPTASLSVGASPSATATQSPGWSVQCPDPSWYRPANATACFKPLVFPGTAGWTWGEAASACSATAVAAGAARGSLGGPASRAEADYQSSSRCGLGAAGLPNNMWMGVSSSAPTSSRTSLWTLASGRDFAWLRSTEGAGLLWAPGEPNQSGQCVHMYPSGAWDDTVCSDRKLFACCEVPLGTPSASPSLTPTSTAAASLTATATGTLSPTGSLSTTTSLRATATGTLSPTGSASVPATPTPSGSAGATTSATGSGTGSPSSTATQTRMPSASGTQTGSPSSTTTQTRTPSASGTQTGTPSSSSTGSQTGTPSSSGTGSQTGTPSTSGTGTGSPSPTETGSPSGTSSRSAAATGTRTGAASRSGTGTGSRSGTQTATWTGTISGTSSATGTISVAPSGTPSASKLPSVPPSSGIFTYAGAGDYRYFSVPAGVTSLTVHMWGAGGGGGSPDSGSLGGAGAYVSGTLGGLTPGQTLRIIVGRGGSWIGLPGSDAQGGGGGGWPANTVGTLFGGAGGGRSAVQVRNTSAPSGWTEVATAGGGGGAGGFGQSGGSGGFLSGRRGGDQSPLSAFLQNPSTPYVSIWGGGGGQARGGQGTYTGATGRAFAGGLAFNATRNSSGGGGGGYFGGAAGDDGPGGGGSSFVGRLTGGFGVDGLGPVAPGTWVQPYVQGVASGGAPQSPGGNGLVVFLFASSPTASATKGSKPSVSPTRKGSSAGRTISVTGTPSRSASVTGSRSVTPSRTRKPKRVL